MDVFRVVYAIAVIVISRFILSHPKVKMAFSKASRQNNCAEPPTPPSRDPVFGLDTVFQTFQQMKEHRRMKSVYAIFGRHGHTYQSFPLGRRSVSTIHPQNLDVIFTKNDVFGVGPLRERASEPMIGRGIVSSDGAMWAHARTMMKPTFNRSQIADRNMFSTHVEKFMELLPRDNSEVDLQPLFDRLVR